MAEDLVEAPASLAAAKDCECQLRSIGGTVPMRKRSTAGIAQDACQADEGPGVVVELGRSFAVWRCKEGRSPSLCGLQTGSQEVLPRDVF